MYNSLPLYEGVDWNSALSLNSVSRASVSLFTREWIEIPNHSEKRLICCVSLFTREWIEIAALPWQSKRSAVSLFTREWIEIILLPSKKQLLESPSLRGSGLKFRYRLQNLRPSHRLPLYEGVDWNFSNRRKECVWICLPLYEGVDWNSNGNRHGNRCRGLPLYEGVDWN